MQHIPDYKKFVNERINLKASHLSSEDYQKAKKLKAFNSTDWLWNPKSNLYDKVNESLVTEAKFFRLPNKLNAMWELKNSVDYIVGKHKNGDDYNPAEMKTIEEFIKKIKKSVKSFKDAEEVKGTIYESVNEGKGQDLADKYVAKLRTEFKKLNDDELGEFRKTIAKAFDLKESVNEAKGYYIKVAVRDAKKALSILDDMYRKKFDISGSDTYYFKDEDMAYDAKMDLGARDIEITDTNIEESLDEKAGPCWDNYKIGSPKTKISSQSGKRVNNCVPIDEEVNEATYNSKNHIGSTSDGQGSNAEIYKKGKGYYVVVSGEADYDFDAKNDKELLKKLKDNEFDSTDILEVNEAIDINDPVLVAMRAFRTSYLKKGKATPKVKKISTTQYYKLMDREIDIIDQMKDASKEFEQLVSDMNNEAGQKGAEWTDADANRYGGDLDKIQTKIEKLTLQKKKVQDQIKNYRMS